MDRSLILDLIFTMLFVYYGYKYRYLTPSYEGKKGLMTPHTKRNKENWIMGHEFAGMLSFIYAAILAVIFGIKFFFIGYGTWFDWAHLIFEIFCVFSLSFFTDLYVKKHGNSEMDEWEDDKPSPGLRNIMRDNTVQHKKNGKKKKKK